MVRSGRRDPVPGHARHPLPQEERLTWASRAIVDGMKRIALLALLGLSGCYERYPAHPCGRCQDAATPDAAIDADARDGGDSDDAD